MREWFDVLSKEILNPDYALFTQSADGNIAVKCSLTSQYFYLYINCWQCNGILIVLMRRVLIFTRSKAK